MVLCRVRELVLQLVHHSAISTWTLGPGETPTLKLAPRRRGNVAPVAPAAPEVAQEVAPEVALKI